MSLPHCKHNVPPLITPRTLAVPIADEFLSKKDAASILQLQRLAGWLELFKIVRCLRKGGLLVQKSGTAGCQLHTGPMMWRRPATSRPSCSPLLPPASTLLLPHPPLLQPRAIRHLSDIVLLCKLDSNPYQPIQQVNPPLVMMLLSLTFTICQFQHDLMTH